MHSDPILNRALEAIHHLSDPEPPWGELLRGMQGVIGGDSATLVTVDGNGELLGFLQNNISAATQQAYARHFCAHDILIPPTIGAQPGSWFDTNELFSSSFLSGNRYYADFMCRHDARHMLAHIVEESPQRRSAFTVQRSVAVGQVRRRLEGEAVRRVMDAFRHGMAQREMRAAQWFRDTEAAFGVFGEAVCLVTPSGLVLRCSNDAHHRLETQGLLRTRGGRLWHPVPRVRDMLAVALRRAAQEPEEPIRLAVPDGRGGTDRLELVRATPLLSTGAEALVLVRMQRRNADAAVPEDALCMAFGITPAEARVLAALMAGQSPKQHAIAQGVSVHTVRSQVAALMGKMGCVRQVDLVRMGAALR